MKITYTTEAGHKIDLWFETQRTTMYFADGHGKYGSRINKDVTRETKCTVFIDGFIFGVGAVRKDSRDKDDLTFAMRLAAKKVMHCLRRKDRIEIWKLIIEQTRLKHPAE